MGRHAQPRSRTNRDLLELTCALDGLTHLVGVDEFAAVAADHRGAFPALCGHVVTVGSMSAPPGPECASCVARVPAARP